MKKIRNEIIQMGV